MIITAKNQINIESNFKVEAGPGAGKTEFLVNHMKNVIANSKRLSNTRKIASITYTNSAAQTLLERLGSGVSDLVEITTIHSFLYRNVVKPYCSFISGDVGLCSKMVKGHDDVHFNLEYIRQWIDDGDFDNLRPPNTKAQILSIPHNARALQNWLSSMKCTFSNGSVTFECDNNRASTFDKNDKYVRLTNNSLEILSKKIIDLKKLLWKRGRLDHNDVLYFSFILVERYPFILEVLRAKFPYMFIDEYQDTNPIQSHIIDLIRKKETVVGVIGDKAQSIYSFQGADLHLFDTFAVQDSCHYTINDNYRSSNSIVSLLNRVRKDLTQKAVRNKSFREVTLIIGERIAAYKYVLELCGDEKLTSLSRENVVSNAMKVELESNGFNSKVLEQFANKDSDAKRRNCVGIFIEAIEHARNGEIKESIKRVERIYNGEENPKKMALSSLSKILGSYDKYFDKPLIEFFNTINDDLELKLPKVTKGRPKTFYDSVSYKELAIGFNITEDTSNHITIHKSKGMNIDNVFVTNNNDNDLIKFLVDSNLTKDEEHRVLYVAMSRTRNRLFVHLNNLSQSEERRIKSLHPSLIINRL